MRISAEMNVALHHDASMEFDDEDADAWDLWNPYEWDAGTENALLNQLRLSASGDGPHLALLAELVDELEVVLRKGAPKGIEKLADEIVGRVLMDRDLLDLIRIMKAFGWSKERIGDVRVKDLSPKLRAMVASHLVPAVADMLNRWEEGGIFDLKDRRKKQPRYRAEVRRERSMPLYQPRGRT